MEKVYQKVESLLDDCRSKLMDKIFQVFSELEKQEMEPEIYLIDYENLVYQDYDMSDTYIDDQITLLFFKIDKDNVTIDNGCSDYDSISWDEISVNKLIEITRVIEENEEEILKK